MYLCPWGNWNSWTSIAALFIYVDLRYTFMQPIFNKIPGSLEEYHITFLLTLRLEPRTQLQGSMWLPQTTEVQCWFSAPYFLAFAFLLYSSLYRNTFRIFRTVSLVWLVFWFYFWFCWFLTVIKFQLWWQGINLVTFRNGIPTGTSEYTDLHPFCEEQISQKNRALFRAQHLNCPTANPLPQSRRLTVLIWIFYENPQLLHTQLQGEKRGRLAFFKKSEWRCHRLVRGIWPTCLSNIG